MKTMEAKSTLNKPGIVAKKHAALSSSIMLLLYDVRSLSYTIPMMINVNVVNAISLTRC